MKMHSSSFLVLLTGIVVGDFAFAGPVDPCQPGQATVCGNCVFAVEDATLLTGSTDNEILIRATNDICLFGYSVGVEVADSSKVIVTGFERLGTVAGADDVVGAAFFDGGVGPDGSTAGVGVVFDFGNFAEKNLPPGSDAIIWILKVDVLADTDTSVSLSFTDVQIDAVSPQPIKNVMTNVDGRSVAPATMPGTLTLQTQVPVIDSVLPGTGLAGTEITISGQHFDHAGLVVEVCGQPVAPTSLSAGTITLNVPACGTIGCVDVVVTTVRGSDTETEGFCYECPPPAITVVAPPSGTAGDTMTITGTGLDCNGLKVIICGIESVIQTNDDTTIIVTVPECAENGAVDVTVMHDFGMDTAAGTFEYTSGERFKRGDSNFDGDLDISDPISLLNYLFIGGEAPSCPDAADANDDGGVDISDPISLLNFLFLGSDPPPAPGTSDCGPDTTVDELGACEDNEEPFDEC